MSSLFAVCARSVAALVLCSAAAAHAPAAQIPQPAAGGADDATVAVSRFWRTDGSTLVEGTIGVRLVQRGDSVPAPEVHLTVRDAAGNVLYQETWQQKVSAELARMARRPGGVEVPNPFTVALQKGDYSVLVRVSDGSARDSAVLKVSSFMEAPTLSDLLLSPSIRVLREGEKPVSGELQRSVYAVVQAPHVTLTSREPTLWYYVEAYAPAGSTPDSVRMDFSIETSDGARTLARSARTFEVLAPGRPDVGKLDVTGLPPGNYRLVVHARRGSVESRREALFAMAEAPVEVVASPVAALEGAAARLKQAEDLTMLRYFSGQTSDSAVAALVEALTVAPPGERVPKETLTLSPAAQRRFLARYWAHLDATPGTPANERLEEYVRRLDYVNRNFAERDIKRSAVRTDRGRIYLKYGRPDEKLNRPMTRKGEIDLWRYTKQRNLKFLFLDDSGFDHFNLIMTTDPNESTQPNWADLIGDPEILRLIESS